MAKNTSILLGDHFDKFIGQQMATGRYSSASEVIRAALRVFEEEETKKQSLIADLKEGERSGFVSGFDRKDFISNMHDKHLKNGL
ncbi:MAG: type II toxin-antitoxin system ParD family antitoxin [Chitinophagaceae bacterium]